MGLLVEAYHKGLGYRFAGLSARKSRDSPHQRMLNWACRQSITFTTYNKISVTVVSTKNAIGELGAARAIFTLVENIKARNQVFKIDGVHQCLSASQFNVWGQLTPA